MPIHRLPSPIYSIPSATQTVDCRQVNNEGGLGSAGRLSSIARNALGAPRMLAVAYPYGVIWHAWKGRTPATFSIQIKNPKSKMNSDAQSLMLSGMDLDGYCD